MKFSGNTGELKVKSVEISQAGTSKEFNDKNVKLGIATKQGKLAKSQKIESDNVSLIEKLSKQQAERTQLLFNQQAEREEKTMNNLNTMLQQNSLLLVQAFAMSQNSSTVMQPTNFSPQQYFFPNGPFNFNAPAWNPALNTENIFSTPYMQNFCPSNLQNCAQPVIESNISTAQVNQFPFLTNENDKTLDTTNENFEVKTTGKEDSNEN